MGSDLYRVKATAKTDRTVSLEIVVVHPDSMYIPADTSFALMVLHEAAEQGTALATEVSFDDTLDSAWVKKYAKGFVRSVKVSGIVKKRNAMRGRMDIAVSDPAWIAHIEKGESWDSRAFSLISSYDPCEPILPGGGKHAATDEDGFVWVPRECFMDFTTVQPDTPALLQMPAYASSAYKAVDRIEKPSKKVLKSWLGRAAIVGGEYGSIAGLTNYGVVLARYHQGSRGFGSNQAPWIARPELTAGRRGTKLEYAAVIKQAAITATVNKSGTSLELTLRVPPDNRKLPFASETDALHLLVRAAIEEDKFRACPLAKALQADLESHELEGTHRLEEIYPYIAKTYVESVKVASPPRVKPTKDMHALLAGPWPIAKVKVVVTDKKWLAHLDAKATLVVKAWAFPKPKAAPKKKPAPVFEAPDARVVLRGETKVWIAERDGASWTARWGSIGRKERQTKTYKLASAEKAQAEIDKTVAKKLREGYVRAPADAAAIVWKRMGLAFDDASGTCVVTKVAPASAKLPVIDTVWYKPKDQVESVSDAYVSTVEEVACVLAAYAKEAHVYCDSFRPASGVWTKVSVPLKAT